MKIIKDWFSLLSWSERFFGFAVLVIILIIAFKGNAKAATRVSEQEIEKWCEYYKYKDCELVKSIIWKESAFNPSVYNDEKTGSYGLMQIQCSTAKMMGLKYGCDQLFDPQINVRFGILYLNWLKENKPIKTIPDLFAAYNAGSVIVCSNKNYNSNGKLLCYPNEYINYDYVYGKRGVMREYSYRKNLKE